MIETNIRIPTKRELIQEKYFASPEAAALNDHAHHLAAANHVAAAATALRRAVALAPDHPVLLSSLGAVLFDACEYNEAETVLRKSIAIEPGYSPAHANIGSVLGGLGRYAEAKKSFRRALEIEPDFIDAQWNYSMVLLDAGEWAEGLDRYSSRFRKGNDKLYPQLPYPTWAGEDLNGKTLYVQGEQGIGDRTLFQRYLHWVKSAHPQCRIIYMLNAEDLPNVSNFMYGLREIVDEFLPNGIPWPQADFGVYLMSLPGLHGTTPDNVYPDPGLIRKNALRHKNSVILPAPAAEALKVGIAWTGNVGMKRNAERSVPFDMMLDLATLPNVVLYSLQFGSHDIKRAGAEQLICDLTTDIAPFGFAGTAAAMLNLDLVITCCTSVAHVAGALGVPCWTLLCANPYWVWLRGRKDTVWYPNMRLFRQPKMGDWSPVMRDVKTELASLSVFEKLKAA